MDCYWDLNPKNPTPKSSPALAEAEEGLHKVCEAYLWLAMRFPASFPDVACRDEGIKALGFCWFRVQGSTTCFRV